MRRLKTALILAALLASGGCVCAESQEKLHQDQWMGFYAGEMKVGYRHLTARKDKFEGKEVYVVTDVTVTAYPKSRAVSRRYVDTSFSPVYETHELKVEGNLGDSPKKSFKRTEIRYKPGAVECKAESDGKITKKTVPIPIGTDLAAYRRYCLEDKRPTAGEKLVMAAFDWDTLAFGKSTVYLGQRGKVKVRSETREATPVFEDDGKNVTVGWYLDNGEEIKQELSGTPFAFVAESREEATRGIATGTDLQTFAADRDILESVNSAREYQRLIGLGMRLVGVNNGSLAVNDARQSAKYIADQNAIEYDITAKNYDSSKAVRIPITDSSYATWLAASASVQSGDQGIRTQAKAIIGTETDAYKAACKLRQWVYDSMDIEVDTDTPLSAIDILKSKAGDCKHCALLCAALARSVGIPTRVVIGLVYIGDKQFVGHAWVECFVGEWVPLDPTSPFDFVNAMYVKLGEGDDLAGAHRSLLACAAGAHVKIMYYKFGAVGK